MPLMLGMKPYIPVLSLICLAAAIMVWMVRGGLLGSRPALRKISVL